MPSVTTSASGALQMLPLSVSEQPLEISLERLGQPMSLYVPLSKGTQYWEALGHKPGVKAEKALIKLFQDRKRGRVFSYPAPPITGAPKNIWLKPEVSDELDAFAAAENASSITAVLIAALKNFLGSKAPDISGPSSGAPIPRKGRRRKGETKAAPAELTL
jgi:hypothetical protein